MRRFAMRMAILGFLGLSAVGMFSGVPAFKCALRALAGAVILYFVVAIAGRIVLHIVVDAIVDSASREQNVREAGRDNAK